jgi:hypothetical protein
VKLADKGLGADPVVLTGSFRVSTSTPATASRPGSAVMRPADPALSGQMRVIATFGPGASIPAEGSVISLSAETRYLVREVRRGLDGQVNVQVEQR